MSLITTLTTPIETPTDAHIAALAAAANPHVQWKSGYFYSTATNVVTAGSTTNLLLVANRLYAEAVIIPPGESIVQLACSIPTPGGAGSLLKLLVFDEATDGRAGTLIESSTNIAADAGGQKVHTLATPILGPRVVHVACWSDGAPTLLALAASGQYNPYGDTSVNFARNYGFYRTLTFGTAPASFGTPDGSIGTTGPLICVVAG